VHSSADQTRFERVQMPVDQRILMMKVVKLFRAALRAWRWRRNSPISWALSA
jgi:hypothetical protein